MTCPQQTRRDDQSGLVLINVLVILALTSALLMAMVRASDLSLAQARIYADAAQAQALIEAAEASAIAALARDLRDAPQADHAAEPWARISQAETRIEAGTFALDLSDAQGRLNLTGLSRLGVLGPQILTRLVARLDLPADTTPRILARLAARQPLASVDRLVPEAGLAPESLARLRPFLTLLPEPSDLNLNSVPEDLLFALTDNPVQARHLIALRARKGFLTQGDMAEARVILPAGTGLTSRYFTARARVSVGQVSQSMQSLLRRDLTEAGVASVRVIVRHSLP